MTGDLELLKNGFKNSYTLPRGGFLVDSPVGYIQFGSPPETIKDTMSLSKGVPEIFVLTEEMFSWIKGISVGEIEFPIYFNFFIRNKKTLIICRNSQLARIKKVLQESIFGPQNLDLTDDYKLGTAAGDIPNLKNELNFFRGKNKLSNMVRFGIIRENKFTCKNFTIQIDKNNDFILYHNKKIISRIPGVFEYKAKYNKGERLKDPYLPPLFAVTCLGPSHGFDPQENTSGFIIWLNHQGVMVDPPVNSTEWLVDSNVSPKFIDSIILTHCHADHDAGTFQKILEEGKVTVYATKTVMMSFLRKYSALSGVSINYLMKLFDFHPIQIGRPIYINGGKFDFFYTLHSIPCVGFKMEFQDQSFVYSSDHNNDPEIHRKMYKEKAITKKRYDELQNFPWSSKVIYHESGVPPLHTPIKYLDSIDDKIKEKTVVYHIAKKDFPEKTKLTLAKFGMENTLYFKTEAPEFEQAYQALSVFKRLDFISDMPIWKSQEFINIVEKRTFKKGDLIIEKGTTGTEFYIIYAGNISVHSDGLAENKIYGPYDYFGEVALINEQKRAANVYAETDVILYTIEKDRFLNFIVGSNFEKILKRVAAIRSSETWNLIRSSNFFKYCTSSQITWLESMLTPVKFDSTTTLLKEGDRYDKLYFIRKGEVEVSLKGKKISTLKKSHFIGSLTRLYMGQTAKYTFKTNKGISLFAIEHKEMFAFLKKNPGLIMKFSYDFMEQ